MEKIKSIRRSIENSYVFLDLKASNKDEAISEMLIRAEGEGLRVNVTNIFNGINEKEAIMTSGLGYGVAFPHVATSEVSEINFIFGISKKGIDYGARDNKPVYLFCMILSKDGSSNNEYVSYLSLLSKTLRFSMYTIVLTKSETEDAFKEKMIDILEGM